MYHGMALITGGEMAFTGEMTMAKPIRGKIAKVLHKPLQVVLNIGEKQGVTADMCFDVMDTSGGEVRCPDTDEVLGEIERPKIRVEVLKVQERLCVACVVVDKGLYLKEDVEIFPGRGMGPFARALMPQSWKDKHEHIDLKIGDVVVQVCGEEQESE